MWCYMVYRCICTNTVREELCKRGALPPAAAPSGQLLFPAKDIISTSCWRSLPGWRCLRLPPAELSKDELSQINQPEPFTACCWLSLGNQIRLVPIDFIRRFSSTDEAFVKTPGLPEAPTGNWIKPFIFRPFAANLLIYLWCSSFQIFKRLGNWKAEVPTAACRARTQDHQHGDPNVGPAEQLVRRWSFWLSVTAASSSELLIVSLWGTDPWSDQPEHPEGLSGSIPSHLVLYNNSVFPLSLWDTVFYRLSPLNFIHIF